MYNTLNNPSAHPSYSHYYLLSPSTLFFFFCTSYCFLHILLFFAHLFCTSYCLLHILLFFAHLIVLHFFIYFIAHFTLISPFLTICMPLCYVTLYNLYSYYFALSTERTWFDYISLLIIPCITIMWQIKKPWPWPWPWENVKKMIFWSWKCESFWMSHLCSLGCSTSASIKRCGWFENKMFLSILRRWGKSKHFTVCRWGVWWVETAIVLVMRW